MRGIGGQAYISVILIQHTYLVFFFFFFFLFFHFWLLLLLLLPLELSLIHHEHWGDLGCCVGRRVDVCFFLF
jgi:IS4 transposase